MAEARGEAARIVGAANDEAAKTLDSTREMAAQLLDEARVEARQVGEAERDSIASEVEALKARRDFLESDVQQLELFLTEQRNRLREAATSIVGIVERVPGGLGEVRAPLLSASDDEEADGLDAIETSDGAPAGDDGAGQGSDDFDTAVDEIVVAAPADDELVIVADVAESDGQTTEPTADDAWGDDSDEPVQATSEESPGNDRDEDDFRFSFDDDRT